MTRRVPLLFLLALSVALASVDDAAASPGTTTRVSVASDGTQANDHSNAPSISATAHFVAFASDATSLVEGDTNGVADIFVHDNQTGATQRVSLDSSGSQADGASCCAEISADGRYVAFSSLASNLVPGDTNTCPLFFSSGPSCNDVFVHDLQTGATVRESLDSGGAQANGPSYPGGLSADGRFVAFMSFASNLVAGDTNDCGFGIGFCPDIFVRVTCPHCLYHA